MFMGWLWSSFATQPFSLSRFFDITFAALFRCCACFFSMTLVPALITSSLFVWAILPITKCGVSDLIRMFLCPLSSNITMTRSTSSRHSRFDAFIAMKEAIGRRKIVQAVTATTERERFVDHSASLSLYLKWNSADGEINRSSGSYSLADKAYFTARWGTRQ